MKEKIAIALTIAGSDSSAGAGVQADIKSSAACGAYMASVITSITAQNTKGVSSIENISTTMVEQQMKAVFSDMNVASLKTGMVPTKEMVDIIVEYIKSYNITNVVVDPVMISTSGSTLISSEAITAIIKSLLPITLLVTPNTIEASYISGIEIKSRSDFDMVAEKFKKLGVKFLLLKGGHVDGEVLTDVLYNCLTGESQEFVFDKIDTVNTHGTGCSLSSSIAAYLAQGYDIFESVSRAEAFVHEAIYKGKDAIYGDGFGPIKHFDYGK